MNLPSPARSALVLALFACAAAALLATVHLLTKEDIAEAQQRARLAALYEIVPRTAFDNELLKDTIAVTDPLLGSDQPVTIYRARHDGRPVAVVMDVVTPEGYSGPIRMLIGIRADGSLAGVRVTQHQETPGLGDKLDTDVSDWILQFEGLSLEQPATNQWALKEDGGVFDGFTGASITPRAVIAAVKKALLYFEQHQAKLFSKSADASAQPQ